jgi:hypothetical protein
MMRNRKRSKSKMKINPVDLHVFRIAIRLPSRFKVTDWSTSSDSRRAACRRALKVGHS